MIIANPVYDVVFKYMMEDTRIARTILSALLKVEVVEVEVRPHEYSNDQRDSLSVFRIDFGATIRKADGSQQLILVELQKTWLETETLRFRQYLGIHYSNPKNMVGENALPTVAVYLLGHKVGDIEEPVIYVHHQSYDYDGRLVTKGMPNTFIESLTHDSIIVQIPRLRGQINNRLDKVLSVFDQTRKDKNNEHVLQLDEALYSDDQEMNVILHRLTMAAADADLRHSMNVEDEYFSAIERRDTELMRKDKQLAEKNVLIAEKDELLAEKDDQLAEKDGQLAEKEELLAEKDGQLAEKDGQLAEKNGQLAEKDGQLAEKDGQLAEKDGQLNELLRTSVLSLHQAGLGPEAIADTLKQELEFIKSILS